VQSEKSLEMADTSRRRLIGAGAVGTLAAALTLGTMQSANAADGSQSAVFSSPNTYDVTSWKIAARPEVTAQSDVYALGCVMIECLTGKPPFADREGMRILWAHLQEEPPDPSAARPDLPADVGWALLRALEKEPSRRPATATAYAHMVRIAATGASRG